MITVIGGGLAGSEAAWQLAKRGNPVRLLEMRPHGQTPAHHSSHLAELVCSNSLGSKLLSSGSGLLKAELRRFNSLILEVAELVEVPAGGALAVDRGRFAKEVTHRIEKEPLICLHREECHRLPDGVTIIATGPLSSPSMAEVLMKLTGYDNLCFYDAAAPIVTGESIDYEQGFWAARYEKGPADYFNCPLSKEEYAQFWEALVAADRAPLHAGVEDDVRVFEGCMPIEVMAERGEATLRFGPLRPVGLVDRDGRRPYAVLQLRKENTEASLFNLVGMQTRLTWTEQRRVFGLVPALRQAEFVRFGVMHRNTFINAPNVLLPTYQLAKHPQVFVAGQLTGVEGYVESVASGLAAAINAHRLINRQELLVFPEDTMMGALARYVTKADRHGFQPMNANFGILPPLAKPIRDKQKRKQMYSARSLQRFDDLREY